MDETPGVTEASETRHFSVINDSASQNIWYALQRRKQHREFLFDIRDRIMKQRVRCAEIELSLALQLKSPLAEAMQKLETCNKEAVNVILSSTNNDLCQQDVNE
ncbi:hypothetical protein CHUAL_009313 [Chamberlinius hualienensis]